MAEPASGTAGKRKDDVPPWAAGTEGRLHELDPKLSPEQIETLRPYGSEQRHADGALLWEMGARDAGLFLVEEGRLDIVRQLPSGEDVAAAFRAGHYSGELAAMTGSGALVAGRAHGALKGIAIPPQRLRDLIATEAELGETILLSLILRRMRMIAEHIGEVILIGVADEPHTNRLRQFLSRNGIPHRLEEADTVSLAGYDLTPDDLPAVVCGHTVLKRPDNRTVADCLGMTATLVPGGEYDVAIVGAGPAGLAAAVYAASEGLKAVVFESCAIGGQAGSSSRIENYLGFPTGISGQALTGRAFIQAQKFGAEVALARELTRLECGAHFHTVELDSGERLKARAVVIASGAVYRRPPLDCLNRFQGAGVHYGASHIEGQLCNGRAVAIIGGGNSAGQAAVFLSRRAAKVHMLIRGGGFAESMSQYLITRIEHTANIVVHPYSEVVNLEGDQRLEAALLRDNRSDTREKLDVSHLFVFVGAVPSTAFADGRVVLDQKGFVKTGDALEADDLAAAHWPLTRKPRFLETSCPRIFAAGDVRSGSIKRVASAAGEGAICVHLVHAAIAELAASEKAASDTAAA